MATPKGGGGEAWHFVRDSYWPTAAKAIERMKRGDHVPPAECGYHRGREGTTCRPSDFDPFIWDSLLANELVARGAGTEPVAPEPVVMQPVVTRPPVDDQGED